MTIVDDKFMYFSNRGKVFSFDYYDADSLLLGMSFKPTLSNAQAIRSIYAPINDKTNTITLNNGSNEVLNYHFTDRLHIGEDAKGRIVPPTSKNELNTYKQTMGLLQQVKPPEKPSAFQITNIQDGYIVEKDKTYHISNGQIIRRLVLPNSSILSMLLDDGDEQNNPKYTGVMPGIQANFTIQGIGGLRTFMMFLVRNLPAPYSHNDIVFRITEVQETIEAGKWVTNIVAGVIPLRDYIKDRLGIAP